MTAREGKKGTREDDAGFGRLVGTDVAGGRFRTGKILGEGSFGVVFRGVEKAHPSRAVAIKFESTETDELPQLETEYRVYTKLQSVARRRRLLTPEVYWFGDTPDGKYRVMVMELFDASLEDLRRRGGTDGRRMSLKTVLMLADQMLARLEASHAAGIVHRDIKPDNFLMGTGEHAHHVYLIDYGLCKRLYTSSSEGQRHAPLKTGKQLTGTPRYASLNTHRGLEQSRRDDLESLGFVLVFLLKGRLPWQGIRVKDMDRKTRIIGKRKEKISPEELCAGLPAELLLYFRYCRGLDYEQEPDYVYLRRTFRNLFWHEGYVWDYAYDWADHHRTDER